MDGNIVDEDILSWDPTRSSKDISAVDIGNNYFAISCTIGKLLLWFGRRSTPQDVGWIIQSIARIDSSAEHEKEVICDFDEITDYENKGCTVVSYARNKGGRYRVIFNVPLRDERARRYFIDTILEELRHTDTKKTLHWNGTIAKIMLLFKELKQLPGTQLLGVKYKEENE